MKGQDNRKYAIYSRKSKFTGKGESIENQIELCRQHIKLHHGNVTEEDILCLLYTSCCADWESKHPNHNCHSSKQSN